MSRSALFALVGGVLLAAAVGISVSHFSRLHVAGGGTVPRAVSPSSGEPTNSGCFNHLGAAPLGSYAQALKAAAFPALAPRNLLEGFTRHGGTPAGSYPRARKDATFPVLAPTKLPPGFTLVSIKEHDLARLGASKAVQPLLIESGYCASAGHVLVIDQGYTAYSPAMSYRDAPEGSKGTVLVDGKQAYWVRGVPARPSPGGRAWWPDYPSTSLDWQSGTDDLVPRYVSLASNTLDVDQLVAVAASLG